MFDVLYHRHYNIFERLIGTNPRRFWEQIRPDDPKFGNLQDMLLIENWQDQFIPYVIHGDKAQFTNKGNDSLLSIQWTSLLVDDFTDPICSPALGGLDRALGAALRAMATADR